MIIIDFSQMFLSCVFTQPADMYETEDNIGMIRHLVLNHFITIKRKFNKESKNGNIVFACDGQNYWRKQFFPYYKAARKAGREKTAYNFDVIFKFMSTIKTELKENFPYKLIEEFEAEADDVIGTLSHHLHKYETVVIVSSDKDFKQLHKYHSIKQYDPYKKQLVVENRPEEFLQELIIRGDASDGIPNIISADDVFVTKTRQKPITKKFLEESRGSLMHHFDHYLRNKTLIDFSEIPLYIQENIIKKYDSYETVGRGNLFKYFISKNLTNLIDQIDQF
jgi:hypothetical protein